MPPNREDAAEDDHDGGGPPSDFEVRDIRMFSVEQAIKICDDYEGLSHTDYMKSLLSTAARLEAYVCYTPNKPGKPKPACKIVNLRGDNNVE